MFDTPPAQAHTRQLLKVLPAFILAALTYVVYTVGVLPLLDRFVPADTLPGTLSDWRFWMPLAAAMFAGTFWTVPEDGVRVAFVLVVMTGLLAALQVIRAENTGMTPYVIACFWAPAIPSFARFVGFHLSYFVPRPKR